MRLLAKIIALSFALFSVAALAQDPIQSLPMHSFVNQWDKPTELNKKTKWLVLSQSKDAGAMVKEAFDELKVQDTSKYGLLYVADISAMPGFITKLFALPKMRDFAFPVALIKEEGDLAALKLANYNTEKVVMLELNSLKVMNTTEFDDKAVLVAQLEEIIK